MCVVDFILSILFASRVVFMCFKQINLGYSKDHELVQTNLKGNLRIDPLPEYSNGL